MLQRFKSEGKQLEIQGPSGSNGLVVRKLTYIIADQE